MTKRIAVIASSIHPIRQKHLLEWYEDLLNADLTTQLFLGSKDDNIPYAINYKINSKLEKLKYLGLNLFKFKLFRDFKRIQPLVNYKPAIIHLLTSNAFVNIEPILESKSLKLIVSFRGYDLNVFPRQSEKNLQLTQRIFEKADVLHFISEDLKKTALQMNANPEKCLVINRSIRTTTQVDLKKHRTSNKRSIILSVGRLVWEKGYLYALETVAILKNRGIDFQYQIVGSGVDFNMLIFHSERLNITSHVNFLGELAPEDIKKKLIEADIYFQPSLTEALSLAIIEASYYGLPVVSSNIGGIPEVVEDAVSGFLSDFANPEEYANNITKLMMDQGLRIMMGNAGHKRIKENFSRGEEIEKWKKVYNSLTE